MAVRFPTREDSDVLKNYLDRLKYNKKYFDFEIKFLVVTEQDVQEVIETCNCLIHQQGRIISFFASRREEPTLSNIPLKFETTSVNAMMHSNNISHFLSPFTDDLNEILDGLKKGKEALQQFNRSHGFLWTVDFPLLKYAQKEEMIEYKAFEGTALETEELGPFLDALTALNIEDIPVNLVKEAYSTFIQSTSTCIDWITSFFSIQHHHGEVPQVGSILPGSNSSDVQRVRSIRLFEVHDTHQVYNQLVQGSKGFFDAEYQIYDEHSRGSALKVFYMNAARDVLEDIRYEIDRLEAIQGRGRSSMNDTRIYPVDNYNHSNSGVAAPVTTGNHSSGGQGLPTIVFNPSIHQMYFLYRTLLVYLSCSIHVESVISTAYFEKTYATFVRNAQTVVGQLQALPQYPRRRETTDISPMENGTGEASQELAGNHLQLSLELYRDVRRKVNMVSKNLEVDILLGKRVLYTVDASTCTFSELGLEIQQLEFELRHARAKREEPSFWQKTKSMWNATMGILTCKAEYNPNVEIIKNVKITKTSPFIRKKEKILGDLKVLQASLEEEGIKMEKALPGVFFRGQKERVINNFGAMISKGEKYSVLFGLPPGRKNSNRPRTRVTDE